WREAEAAAHILSARLIVLHPEAPRRLEDMPMHELVRRLDILFADQKPDLVLTHRSGELHFDHELTHRATLSALRRQACDVLAYSTCSSDLDPHGQPADCHADITSTIETKLLAVAAHRTQIGKLDLD